MKTINSILVGFLLVLVFCLTSCAPMSKEAYLDDFSDFIKEVAENHESYSAKDWRKASEKYEKFTGDWYDKFEEELSFSEKAKVKAFQAKWLYYSEMEDAVETVGTIIGVVGGL